MISLSRSLIQQFRSVARRAGLCKSGLRQSGSVRILATPETVRLQATNGRISIELQSSGQGERDEITAPIQFLADCESKKSDLVTIRRNENGQIVTSWNDRGIPQQHDYEAGADLEMPSFAEQFVSNPPTLLIALRDAMATTEDNSTRYALNCLQLDGTSGSIAATDSHQLLIQSGFQFPWPEKLLIPKNSIYASKDLPTDLPIEIGCTKDGVTIRFGNWTIHHALETGLRFPDVARIVPDSSAIKTRLLIEEADAKFLAETADRLPAGDEADRPVTLELNGAVVVRARKDKQSPLMELLLSRSHRTGAQMRLQTNRSYLMRALEMGFSEIGFVSPDAACLCQDATRSYVWGLLENEDALESDPEAIRLDSTAFQLSIPLHRETVASPSIPAKSVTAVAMTTPVNRVKRHMRKENSNSVDRHTHGVSDQSSVMIIDTFQQIIDLRNQLQTCLRGVSSLAKQLRQQRKQNLLMRSTLKSLQQLQLLDA